MSLASFRELYCFCYGYTAEAIAKRQSAPVIEGTGRAPGQPGFPGAQSAGASCQEVP